MSKSDKKKEEFCISVEETVEKLRTIADELERGVVVINEEECSVAIETQVEFNLKAKDDKFSCKLKLKLSEPSIEKKEKYLEKDKVVTQSNECEDEEEEVLQSDDQKLEEPKDLEDK